MKKLTALCLALATALFATPRLDAATTTTNKVRAATYSQVTNLAFRITTLEEQMAMVQLGHRVVVTALTQDDVTVENQTVSIYEVADGGIQTLVSSTNYNGAPVAFVVPPGMHYHVAITDTVPYHFLPTTAEGYADDNVTYLTLTYLDAGWTNGVSRLTTYSHIQTAVSRLYADKYAERIAAEDTPDDADAAALAYAQDALVGVQIPDTWIDENGTTALSDPMVCVDVGWFDNELSESHVGAVMQRKWATANAIMFDNRNQEIATEETAQDGVYYYGFSVPTFDTEDTSKSYAKDTFCIYDDGGGATLYRCTTASTGGTWVPGNWSASTFPTDPSTIAPYDSTATYEVGGRCRYTYGGSTALYYCSTEVTSPEEFDPAKWTATTFDAPVGMYTKLSLSAGDAIPYSSYFLVIRTSLNVSSGNYVKDAIRYGHNRWRDSAYRQYLNSDADKGGWWERKHAGQLMPSNLGTVRGYMAGCSESLLAAAKKVAISTYANSNTDSSAIDITYDTFWLPSGSEMYGSVNANERRPFPYWHDVCYGALVSGGCVISNYDDYASFPVTGVTNVVYHADDTGYVYDWNSKDATPKYRNLTNNDWDNRTETEERSAYATNGRVAQARRQFGIKNHGSAVPCRLRSANRSHSNTAWNVTSPGNLNHNHAAFPAYVGVPACVIW